jgi:thiol-disulfide isomerase/thioredoxin
VQRSSSNNIFSAIAGPTSAASQLAPDFSFTGPDGDRYRLSELRGGVVVLDFWASWCRPCLYSLPRLEQANRKFIDDDVVFIGVNNESQDIIDLVSERLDLSFFSILDRDDRLSELYGVDSIPCTVIIGRDGRIFDVIIGFHNDNRVERAVQAALAER